MFAGAGFTQGFYVKDNSNEYKLMVPPIEAAPYERTVDLMHSYIICYMTEIIGDKVSCQAEGSKINYFFIDENPKDKSTWGDPTWLFEPHTLNEEECVVEKGEKKCTY